MLDEMNNWVATQLSQNSGVGAYVYLFVGGALASLLPCVYPVYPLTVNFLRTRKSGLGKFAHPIAYYLGLIAIYFSFGIIASLTGGAFNQLLSYPLTNLSIGIVLFLLALATVDMLHIPFFGGEVDSKNQGLWGTGLMGAGAGLLSSACVGPIVVSVLVGIASNSTEINILTISTASAKMTLFGMGVGIPILLLGVFGLTLPKSGKWMVYIQWMFAGLIAYFAYGYLLKGLSGLGFNEQTAFYLLLGAAIFLTGLVNIQSKEQAIQERITRASYGLAAVVGLLLMSSLTLSRSIPSRSSDTQITSEASLIETKGALNWHLDKEAAYQEAKKTGKLVFIDFHADWCTNCKAFQEKTQTDSALNKALQKSVLYKVYDTSLAFEAYKADPRFPELKVGIPFFIITDAAGNVLYKTSDYTQTDEMILFLD